MTNKKPLSEKIEFLRTSDKLKLRYAFEDVAEAVEELKKNIHKLWWPLNENKDELIREIDKTFGEFKPKQKKKKTKLSPDIFENGGCEKEWM